MDTAGLVRKRSADKTMPPLEAQKMSLGGVQLGRQGRALKGQRFSCATIACFGGVLFVLFGACLILWADLDSLQRVQAEKLEEEIDDWERLFKKRWEKTEWNLLVNGTIIGQLMPDPVKETILDSPKLAVESSPRSLMNLIGTVFPHAAANGTTSADGKQVQHVSPQMMDQDNANNEDAASEPLIIYSGPLIWTKSKTTNSWKSCHYAERGFWNSASRECVVWYFLSQLCVKLEWEGNGRWSKSSRYGDVGCNVLNNFNPVSSQHLQVVNWRDSAPPSIKTEQAYRSTVAIYEAHDTYLFAANLTDGGMILAEDRVNEVALGITGLVFGAVLMIPAVLLKLLHYCDSRNENQLQLDEIPFYACQVDDH